MKTTIFATFLALVIALPVVSQAQCEDSKQKNCASAQLGDYDYVGQSTYKVLSAGDVLNLNTVFYANYNYRVILCNDPALNPITFQVFEKTTEYVNGKAVSTEKEIYNSSSDTKGYFEVKGLKTSKKAVIRISVAEKQSVVKDKCTNILIGSKYSRTKGYKTPGSSM
ncbi:MAG: hypothetical protein KKD31_13385 [Bacteroidetes bacterium]|nr:hypothetical protein [Bacteroidota bacterium]